MLSLKEYLFQPKKTLIVLIEHFFTWLPDKVYLKLLFGLRMGRRLNLDNPQTFSEKIQWLKLYDRNPEYIKMVDKFEVKDYVAKVLGNDYIIPTLGVWDRIEDIEWDALPEKFVLKTTHGGGSSGVIICKDKAAFNRSNAITKLKKSLRQDIYRTLKEWPYKSVKKRIIAEKYIEPNSVSKDLPDYKFFCFNGQPKFCQVISGRETKKCADFFDYNWEHQHFHEPKIFPFAEIEPSRPEALENMWLAATKLAKDKTFSRIDFYEVGGSVYFGEITFFPTSGMGGFNPQKWDEIFGSWIQLPAKTN